MPKPNEKESQKDFIPRCMSALSKEKSDSRKTQTQKLGKCYGIYRNSKKKPQKEDISDINSFIDALDKVFDLEDLQQ